jgi:DNA-directed RNA polymerase subunit E'/Rpb7
MPLPGEGSVAVRVTFTAVVYVPPLDVPLNVAVVWGATVS